MLSCKWMDYETAYDITQCLSGTLFLTVDSLLLRDYSSDEEILSAHAFIKDFIRFLARWLKWMSENPQTVSSAQSRLKRCLTISGCFW